MKTNESLDEMIKLVVKPTGNVPIHNCLLYLNDTKRSFSYARVKGKRVGSSAPVEHTDGFRTGSITKPFTATVVLQLMEEGALALNDCFVDLVSGETKSLLKNLHLYKGVNHTNSITVKDLLTHKSGLEDYFSADERFFEHVSQFPQQPWNWKRVMEKYFAYELNRNARFRPGAGFHYADTNYLLLAAMIEEICNVPFYETLERRVLLPLGLSHTHLEFHQKAKEYISVIYPCHGNTHLKEVNTSFDWGGGGLVSTASDLDVFIRALANGKLFTKPTTLKTLLAFEEDGSNTPSSKIKYRFGLQERTIAGSRFIGHTSAYGSVLFFDPINELSIIISLNQMAGMHKVEWLLRKLVREYL